MIEYLAKVKNMIPRSRYMHTLRSNSRQTMLIWNIAIGTILLQKARKEFQGVVLHEYSKFSLSEKSKEGLRFNYNADLQYHQIAAVNFFFAILLSAEAPTSIL